MKKTTLFLVVALAFGITATTEAAVAVFGTEADYNAATGPQIFLINFNGNLEGGEYVNGGSFDPAVSFGSPEASTPTLVLWNSDAITDAGSTSASNGVGPVNGVFTDPVYAFALEFSSAGVAETVSLYDEGSVLLGAVTAPNPSGFFGVVSDTPVKFFFIDNGDFPEGTPDRFFIDDFRANELLIIQVNIDIKPGSCPNPFNGKAKGVTPVAIVGSIDFDVADVDPTTITLAGISPVKWSYDDSTQPVENPDCETCFNADDWLTDTDDDGIPDTYIGDGYLDLVLQFDTRELAAAVDGGVLTRDDCAELVLTGEKLNGVPIEGTDFIIIKTKNK